MDKLHFSHLQPILPIGSESWLDGSVKNAEVFSLGFSMYQNDRQGQGAGVFLLISNNLHSTQLSVPEHGIEAVWLCAFVCGLNLIIGSYYRFPCTDCKSISILEETCHFFPNDTILLGGNFNIPSSSMHDKVIILSRTKDNNKCLAFINAFNFRQYVTAPTRNENILDSLLHNAPSMPKKKDLRHPRHKQLQASNYGTASSWTGAENS